MRSIALREPARFPEPDRILGKLPTAGSRPIVSDKVPLTLTNPTAWTFHETSTARTLTAPRSPRVFLVKVKQPVKEACDAIFKIKVEEEQGAKSEENKIVWNFMTLIMISDNDQYFIY